MKRTTADIITGIITLVGLLLLEQGRYLYGLLTLILSAIGYSGGVISDKLDQVIRALEDLKE